MVNLPNIFLSKLFGALHIDIEVIKIFDTKIKMINSIIRILQEDFFGATRKAKRKARIFLGTIVKVQAVQGTLLDKKRHK